MNGTELTNSHFVFREAQSAAELHELLKLRYRVYRQSRLAHLVPENSYGIDIDDWDFKAQHFGLFSINGRFETPVGYQRGVYSKGECNIDVINELMLAKPELQSEVKSAKNIDLPCLAYMPDCVVSAVNELQKDVHRRGGCLGEASRFLIDPELATMHIASFMAKAVIAAYIVATGDLEGLACVSSTHLRSYSRLGFRQLVKGPAARYHKDGATLLCLYINEAGIAASIRREIDSMIDAFARSGQVVYHNNIKSTHNSELQAVA